jgi:uncharacterized protein (TIGR03792 family)
MVIEWLKFQVAEELREKFIQADEAIWTAALAKHSGYLGKQVWISPHTPNEVVIVIHWETLEAWKSFPADVAEATEKRFTEQMGTGTYKLMEGEEYQVRKYPTA